MENNIREIMVFFLVPGVSHSADDYFEKLFNSHVRSDNKNEREYELKFMIRSLERMKEEQLKVQKPSIHYLVEIDNFIEFCEEKKNTVSVDIESRTAKVILEMFTNFDKQGWKYAFFSEQDYKTFTDVLTNFFEYNSYTLPKTPIQLKRTCKTKVAKVLGDIHKELSNENKLIKDTEFFQIIKILNHFEKETENDLYKALTR